MSKSEPKTPPNDTNVCLPFPHPMLTTDGSVVWPFRQKGFPLFYGFINFEEICVEIRDKTVVKVLQNQGFFGFFSKFRFNSFNEQKNEVLVKTKANDLKNETKTESKYLNGKYVSVLTSVPNALTTSEDNKGLEDSQESDPKVSTKDIKSDKNVLKMSFIECFFMSYVFGSLNVLNPKTNTYLTIDEIWETFGSHYSDDSLEFAVHYSAYHYFRSKGWVVRNGRSFGTNFLLYKEGPHLYHAIYSVIIQYSIGGQLKPSFDWYRMSALVRLSRNVRKELIVCVVNIPKDYDISSPNGIKEFQIELTHYNRWNALKGNQNQ